MMVRIIPDINALSAHFPEALRSLDYRGSAVMKISNKQQVIEALIVMVNQPNRDNSIIGSHQLSVNKHDEKKYKV